MRSVKRIRKMIKDMRSLQCDQQYQEQIYPIEDAINALKWVLEDSKMLNLGTCSCRFLKDLERD